MADETTNISRFVNYESDEEGIRDLEHLRRELDHYEIEFMIAQSTAKILAAKKESLERENMNLRKLTEAKEANNAFIKAQTVEIEKYLAKELEKVQQKFERLLSENIRLKKKEVSF